MTIKELKRYRTLFYLIQRNKKHLEELRALAEKTTGALTNEPRSNVVGDKVGVNASKIVDCERLIEKSIEDALNARNHIELWIESIDDDLIKTIIIARFIDLNSWRDIAQKIGGKNTEDSVRKLAIRYIRKN